MRRTLKVAFLLVILAALALPGSAMAKGLQDDKIVAGGSYTLSSGETLDGNLLIFGGAVTLERDSTVDGDVVLMGGTVSIDGTVTGSVVGIGGAVSLEANGRVEGDLTALAAALNRERGSVVEGQVVTGFQSPFQFSLPERVVVPEVARIQAWFSPLWRAMWFFFRTFFWAALAVLLVMFLPNHTERAARAIVDQPVAAGGVGLLTVVVAPLFLIAIALTIVLIPFSLIGGVVLAVAWLLGRVALGLEIGQRTAIMFRQDWPLAVAAGVGTFLLSLVVDGVSALVPCIGWLAPFLVGILGLGGVLLTRFGAQAYPPGDGMAAIYRAPAAPPPPGPAPAGQAPVEEPPLPPAGNPPS